MKLDLWTADISNAYFQGEELDRLLLLKPPPGGLPDPDYADGETMILARVPIYGTDDAGRKFWTRLRRIITSNKFRELKLAGALYVIEVNGKVEALLVTHVDDLLWAVTPEYAKHVEVILREFEINESKRKKNDFRFCGKQVTRLTNGDIFVSCKDGIECIGPVKFSAEGRKQEDPATPAEIGQMRSVVGSLGWVARQCMPISSYAVSRGQSVVTKAKLKDLKDINQALEQAME